MLKKIIGYGFLLSTFLLSLICFYFFMETYTSHSFNEQGRNFDPSVGVVYTDNSFIWGLFSLLALIPTLIFVYTKKKS